MSAQLVNAHREIMGALQNKEKFTKPQIVESLKVAGNLLAEVLDSKDQKDKIQRYFNEINIYSLHNIYIIVYDKYYKSYVNGTSNIELLKPLFKRVEPDLKRSSVKHSLDAS